MQEKEPVQRRFPLVATTVTALIILMGAGGSLWVASRALPARAETPALSEQSVATLTVSPEPISPTGSLAAGANVTITITARDTSQTRIDGTRVYLRLLPTWGGGSARVEATALTSAPQAFTTDATGNIVVTYTTPAANPAGGMDVLVAQNAAAGPSIAASTSYSFAPVWKTTGNMTTRRTLHTATLLPNGKVLIAGGWATGSPSSVLATAELYDPATGLFAATGRMATARGLHTATLLPNGKVLVTGGGDWDRALTGSAELYDPAAGTFSPTGGNGMSVPRALHTGTLLNNGKVLIVGGYNLTAHQTAELYDWRTGSFGTPITMTTAHTHHRATALPDGKVLISGPPESVPEVFDPAISAFSVTGTMITGRWHHEAVLLENGKVLVAAGGAAGGATLSSAELYDPAAGTFSSTGSLTLSSMVSASAILPSGRVLVLGGSSRWSGATGPKRKRAELYDPATGAFFPQGDMSTFREWHTATVLPDGAVLVTGGVTDASFDALSSAEIYSGDIDGSRATMVVLPYGASGYRYKQVSPGDAGGGFESPAFDDSSWAVGRAGFANQGSGACGLPIETTWDEGTAMLLRKQVNLPPGSANVRIAVAIDNDVRVWFNGIEVGNGTHENCATRDSFVFTAPQSALVSGTNLIAVRGLDRFAWTYLDVQVTADVQPATPVGRLDLTPYPIAATGALAAGATSRVTVTARDALGDPIGSARVRLSFRQTPGGGSAMVWSTMLTDEAQDFMANAYGQVTVYYTAPATLPNDGKDTLTAESPMGSPVVSASAPYAFFSSCGDLTGDGATNILDVITSLKLAVQNAAPSSAQTILGDLDRNGVINALDAVRMLQAIVGVGAIDGCGATASG